MAIPQLRLFQLNGGPHDGRLWVFPFFGSTNTILIVGENFDPNTVMFHASAPGLTIGNEAVISRSETEIKGCFDVSGFLFPWQDVLILIRVYNECASIDHNFEVQLGLGNGVQIREEDALPAPTIRPRIQDVILNWNDPDPNHIGKILENADGSWRQNSVKITGQYFVPGSTSISFTGVTGELVEVILPITVNVAGTEILATFNAKRSGTSPSSGDLVVTVTVGTAPGQFWRIDNPARIP